MKSRQSNKSKKRNVKQTPKSGSINKTDKEKTPEEESWDSDYDESIESPSSGNTYYRPAGDRSRNV